MSIGDKRGDWSEQAIRVLKERYLWRKNGELVEDPDGMCWRVARAIARAEEQYPQSPYYRSPDALAAKFYDLMVSREFLPNSPTLMNAGKGNNLQLSACFVIPVPDSIDGIFDAIKHAAIVHKSGGGTGFAFSRLRPEGAIVGTTSGVASGPVSFMRIFDAATEQIKQGGCFVGSTLVATANGPVPIKDLKPGDLVYAWDGRFVLAPCTGAWLTKRNAEVWKLTTDKELIVYATPDHPFMVRHSGGGKKKEYVRLRDLVPGTPLMPLTRYLKDGEWWISLHDSLDTRMPEHVWMARELGIVGEHIHHRDGDHTNNVPDNLVGLTSAEHAAMHCRERFANGTHPFQRITPDQAQKAVDGWKRWYYSLTPTEREAHWRKIGRAKSAWNKRRMRDGTHNFVTDHPWSHPDIKAKAKRSRIARSIWKVMAKGYSVTPKTWEQVAKEAGLYNSQRFTSSSVVRAFGSWESALEYVNERNHRVVSVEFSHYEDVYNVEVPGPHNFVVCDEQRRGVVVSNTRRGANMGILRVDHPDIVKFIRCKMGGGITNFNISVGITDAFMEALANRAGYDLIDPVSGQVCGRMGAYQVWKEIIECAWATGDPGLVFLDRINNGPANPVPEIEQIEATNPCGEQPLGPYDACNLGSINLERFVVGSGFDWDRLSKAVRLAVRFLDDVITVNPYPLPEIREKVLANRRIGLGVMGWADALFRLGIPYNSREALEVATSVMSHINTVARDMSEFLAEERGPFPNWEKSIYRRQDPLRNATRTTIAPTGTISIIANCSSGIEPVFALAYTHTANGRTLRFMNPVLEEFARKEGWSDSVLDRIAQDGTLAHIDGISDDIKRRFVTAHEIAPEWHVRMQAQFQQYTDNGVSKTINLPNSATVDDVHEAYLLAWRTGCLGITVFRDGCKGVQVLNVGAKQEEPAPPAVASEAGPDEHVLVEGAPQLKLRPLVCYGWTRNIKAPEGTVNVTVNSDNDGPIEVFINVGRSGSDLAALAEALGRMISLNLRLPSLWSQTQRLEAITDQLRGIGGSRAVGFGPNQVRSLPDAVAKVLAQYGETEYDMVDVDRDAARGSTVDAPPSPAVESRPTGNICPGCRSTTAFVYEEGCKKCHACGYSEC